MDFLVYIVDKNSHFKQDSIYMHRLEYSGNKQSGLSNPQTLGLIFVHACKHLSNIVLSKPIHEFPVHCFFIRDANPEFNKMQDLDRLGGTLTHLENENKQ